MFFSGRTGLQFCMGGMQPRADGVGVGISRWATHPARRAGRVRALQDKLPEILMLNTSFFMVLFLSKWQDQLGFIFPPEKRNIQPVTA